MTTKYTPGPWIIANESYCPQTDRSGYRIESTTAGGIVCDVIHTGHFAADNPEAHADLIAAAPELAEALQNILFAPSHESLAPFYEDALQALRKAGLVS